MMALWRVMKTVGESLSLLPQPLHPQLVGTPVFATHFWKGESDHMQLKFYSWKSIVKKQVASLLSVMLCVALCFSHHASLVRSSQRTEHGTHENCIFCWSKTFWWGDICASNAISPADYSCLPICAAGAGLSYFERGRKMAFSFQPPPPSPPPPGDTAPPPRILYKTTWIC